jgi:hypothetical protein
MRRALVVACCLVLTGCATRGGVEVEGRASQVEPPPSTQPLPSGTPKSADAVAVLRADPQLDEKTKSVLAPCDYGAYPIDDRYADLTGDGEAELVVIVHGCPEQTRIMDSPAASYGFATGFAGFVYDLSDDPPSRLLGVQGDLMDLVTTGEPGQLILTRFRFEGTGEKFAYEELTVYKWDGAALVEVPR